VTNNGGRLSGLLILAGVSVCLSAVSVSLAQEDELAGPGRWKALPKMRHRSADSPFLFHPEWDLLKEARREMSELLKRPVEGLSVEKRRTMARPVMTKLARIAREYPDVEPGVQALFWKADLMIWARDHVGAIKVFEEIAERYSVYPESVKARVHCAEQWMVLQNPREAIRVLEVVRGAGEDKSVPPLIGLHFKVLTHLAEAYARAGEHSDAERALAQICDEYPKKAQEVRFWYEESVLAGTPEGMGVEESKKIVEDSWVVARLAEFDKPFDPASLEAPDEEASSDGPSSSQAALGPTVPEPAATGRLHARGQALLLVLGSVASVILLAGALLILRRRRTAKRLRPVRPTGPAPRRPWKGN